MHNNKDRPDIVRIVKNKGKKILPLNNKKASYLMLRITNRGPLPPRRIQVYFRVT